MTTSLQLSKLAFKSFKEQLCLELSQQGNIAVITKKLVNYIDELLILLFKKHHLLDKHQLCLLALGSYGRRELQLYSDIDLLVLQSQELTKADQQAVQNFIQDCWDLGLEVGHQITTVKDCADLAATDLTVISTLMDMHLICGNGLLMEELLYQIRPLHMWDSEAFYLAKIEEQKKRYAKYDDTAYNLEPNIKNGPGGLRDLQILLSIGKRHFKLKNLAEGMFYGFITDKEYEELLYCQHFLWRLRFALHYLADKAEDRLLFEYQVKLAQFFGYQDKPHSLAIEQFMKAYFTVIKRCRELNDMLLQWFGEEILYSPKQRLTPLDDEFQLCNFYLEVRNPWVFSQRPTAIMSLFLWLNRRPEIRGVRASTIRLIRESLYLVNSRFRQAPEAIEQFIALLQGDYPPYEALQKMNRYGVLARYLDCFAHVTGQMQYDLFHAYTVDQHTLFVIRNIARFTDPAYLKQFPLAAKVYQRLEKPYLSYLSALFHDIAKGRGGDHSELGALEARQFAIKHNLPQEDADLLEWLVRHHLLMSQTAQRQDIYDPQTISRFCQQLPKAHYLDYLYILTIADICGTNPNLWNAWKDSLLRELYQAAHYALQREKASMDEAVLIQQRKEAALAILDQQGCQLSAVEDLWQYFKGKYFLHESPEVIAQHSKAILEAKHYPIVIIQPHHSQGGTEVFIYQPHSEARFAISTTILSNFRVTIQEAAITSCDNGYDLDTYIILDEFDQAFLSAERTRIIQDDLVSALQPGQPIPQASKRRLSRAQAHFKLKPQISFSDQPGSQNTALFLVTSDRPGLLATLSHVFLKQEIHLHNAKIATAGERVEDMFYLSSKTNQPLDELRKEKLKAALVKALTH